MRLPIDIGAPMLFVSELMVANTSVQGYKDARERVARSVLEGATRRVRPLRSDSCSCYPLLCHLV